MSAPQTLRSVSDLQSVRQRRKAMRYVLHAPVAFCWVDSQGITCHGKGRAQDVSTKGICVVASASPPQGACVAMNIDIPLARGESYPLRVGVEGHVVRSASLGVRFCFCLEYDRVTCGE